VTAQSIKPETDSESTRSWHNIDQKLAQHRPEAGTTSTRSWHNIDQKLAPIEQIKEAGTTSTRNKTDTELF
jgi:hypothetical protein